MTLKQAAISEEAVNTRLDIFLAKSEPDFSRTFIKDWILKGKVFVNGQAAKPHYRLKARDELSWETPQVQQTQILGQDIPLDILYEDNDVIVINKPTGMVVHPGAGQETHTLVHALLYHCGELSSISKERPGIVHRLDKETSGVMVAAKNNQAHLNLVRQFKKHSIRRRYIALVEGSVPFDEGIVDVPLKRHAIDRQKMSVSFSDEAKEARTFYRVLGRFKDYTAVELLPETGRTHQLRVHMSYLGHPILGDTVYGRKKNFSRLALHAKDLGFEHPATKEPVEFSSPLPPEMKKAMPGLKVD
ncbi:ribosomal large subunit pseudouridine synthase D [Candidatus Velamenicoccus archaeovorus]|uniref:Pseudouridine synthase n=1 Tax=Velamenicoccus archaeovorus TaxID=1930593 RepID=A0A410P555_VELA1|nr:RluA family pseudouridine synthase [Candidatus Velamenicoccus archaeovorus]QAT17253.1 ribosomal large subunit pseudouridine synthase D [Candidatus Velamenicoccus archaeovorus]